MWRLIQISTIAFKRRFSNQVDNITIADHFIPIHQGDLFAREWKCQNRGDSRRTPFVLLHDSLGCVELWRDFPKELCQKTGRTVIAYDRLGFGRSSLRSEQVPIDFIQEESREFLPKILKHFALDRFIAFGHSVGGPMAVECGRSVSGCTGIIVESGQTCVEERTLAGIRAAKESFKDATEVRRLEKYHGPKARWVLDAWIETWLSPQFATWSLRETLSHLKVPALVIHGEQDEFGSVAQPKMISDLTLGPCSVHILDNCGHVPHREKPDKVLDLISKFLE